MALDVKQLFDIRSEFIGVTGTQRFGKTIFITVDDKIGAVDASRSREFRTFSDALKFFDDARLFSGPTGSQVATSPVSEPAKAVQAYYKQQKNNPIRVVRWYETDQPSSLTGGTAPADRAVLTAITDGSFEFEGEKFDTVSPLGSDYAQIALVIQNALRTSSAAKHTAMEVTYDTILNRFVVTLPYNSGYTGIQGFFTPNIDMAGTQVGTDLSSLLGLDTGTFVRDHAQKILKMFLLLLHLKM